MRATKDVDIMQWIGEDELWGRLSPTTIEADIGGLFVRIVGYEELIALKEDAGRPEDLIDLERLRQAQSEEWRLACAQALSTQPQPVLLPQLLHV